MIAKSFVRVIGNAGVDDGGGIGVEFDTSKSGRIHGEITAGGRPPSKFADDAQVFVVGPSNVHVFPLLIARP